MDSVRQMKLARQSASVLHLGRGILVNIAAQAPKMAKSAQAAASVATMNRRRSHSASVMKVFWARIVQCPVQRITEVVYALEMASVLLMAKTKPNVFARRASLAATVH